MEKARAKRRRRDEITSAKAMRRKKASSDDKSGGLTEMVIDLAHDAATQVGVLVKSAAKKVSGVVGGPRQMATRRTKRQSSQTS